MLLLLFVMALWAHGDASAAASEPTTPIVLWHGMGDSCCFPFSLGSIKKLLEREINGVYVRSLMIGGNIVIDYESSFFMHPNKQIEDVCRQLASDERLANGYHAIGFSQGGQFLRAVAQRCPNPPMRVLISLGGQHQGIFGLPKCPSLTQATCERVRKMLNHFAYKESVQHALVQATYWHDPLQEDVYRSQSTFLNDINNEIYEQQEYATNLNRLEKFVMVKFLNDTIVQPRESQWFEFYEPGQDVKIRPLAQSHIYDTLGLRDMASAGKLHFMSVEGDHLQITTEWFVKELVPLLRDNH